MVSPLRNIDQVNPRVKKLPRAPQEAAAALEAAAPSAENSVPAEQVPASEGEIPTEGAAPPAAEEATTPDAASSEA